MVKQLLLITSMLFCSLAYSEEIKKAQVNEVDEALFNQIGNRGEIEQIINNDVNGLKNKIQSKEVLKEIPEYEKGLQAENELSNLDKNNLETQGRNAKGLRRLHQKGYFVDYNEPGLKPHLDDAHDLVNSTENLMNRLLDRAKEYGIDCKEINANKEVDPAWHLEIEQRKDRDVIYDKILCEHLRNQYTCLDTLNARCVKRGMVFGNWETREFTFDSHDLWNNHRNWLYSIKWKSKRFGIHLHPYSWVMAQMRMVIANYLKVPVGCISEYINIDARGRNGDGAGTFNISGKDYMFYSYKVGYQYRQGTEVCEQWDEKWDESCRLTSP